MGFSSPIGLTQGYYAYTITVTQRNPPDSFVRVDGKKLTHDKQVHTEAITRSASEAKGLLLQSFG
jgi:hypothetical protein